MSADSARTADTPAEDTPPTVPGVAIMMLCDLCKKNAAHAIHFPYCSMTCKRAATGEKWPK